MNLRFVEAFYWVATLKSVTRAAEKLSLTQSAMSSRIAALEEELGVMLLDRRDRQFRLTIAGMRFLLHAQRMLELQREARAEMGSGTEPAVPLRLGAIESVLHPWLIPWLEALRAERPALALELTVETTPMLLEQIRRGTLDLAFAALPAAGEGVRTRALPPMEMVFVGNARLHRRTRCQLAELAGLDLLSIQRGSQPHVALLDLFRHARLEPRRVHAVSSISAMTQLVEGGFGVATLPSACSSTESCAFSLPIRRCRRCPCSPAIAPTLARTPSTRSFARRSPSSPVSSRCRVRFAARTAAPWHRKNR